MYCKPPFLSRLQIWCGWRVLAGSVVLLPLLLLLLLEAAEAADEVGGATFDGILSSLLM